MYVDENTGLGAATATAHGTSIVKSTSSDIDFLFIGELAEQFSLNPKTIRFYEKVGLLAPARHGKFRTFRKEDAKQLRFILQMRALGLSIANIKSLAGDPQNSGPLLKAILRDHVEDLRQKQNMIERQLTDSCAQLEMLE